MGLVEALLDFHRRLAEGRLAGLDEVFSFESAFSYWCDIANSLGQVGPERGAFARMLEEHFASPEVVAEVRSYTPSDFREKTMGRICSVVFRRKREAGANGADEEGVASMISEGGAWRVRTFPGVFPGGLLSRLRMERDSGTFGKARQ